MEFHSDMQHEVTNECFGLPYGRRFITADVMRYLTESLIAYIDLKTGLDNYKNFHQEEELSTELILDYCHRTGQNLDNYDEDDDLICIVTFTSPEVRALTKIKYFCFYIDKTTRPMKLARYYDVAFIDQDTDEEDILEDVDILETIQAYKNLLFSAEVRLDKR